VNVLFLCAGNTCRSPMAQAIAARVANELELTRWTFASAGRSARDGDRAAGHAVTLYPELESHRAQQLTPELERWADVVVDLPALRVPDPYGADEQKYRDAARIIEEVVRERLRT
jgi:protein-tyrosine-phosphatase